MRKHFRLKLFSVIIAFAILITFTISTIDYIRMKEREIENKQFQMNLVEDKVIDSLEALESIYLLLDSETASKMEEYSKFIGELYEQNPILDHWNFEQLKEQIGMDIYMINRDNVITHSSYASDIGMDFTKCCKKLVPILEERMASGAFFHDGLDIEQNTGAIKKYSYMATKDKKYLIELGYSLQDLELFGVFNPFTVTEKIEQDFSIINHINILTHGGLALGRSSDEWNLSPERKKAFDNTLRTGEVTEVTSDWAGKSAVYRYVAYHSQHDLSATQDKVIEIIYNEDELHIILDRDWKNFMLQLFIITIITVIVSLILSKWLSKPIYLAFHDSLTGLKNRAAFEEDFKSELAKGDGTTGLFLLDLDNFKLVNDHLGHDQGDELLKNVASTMKETVGRNGYVYRLGGDEFSVIIPTTNQRQTEAMAEIIIKQLYHLFLGKREIKNLHVSASLGIVLAPEHGNDSGSLVKKADLTLYSAKAKGKNQYDLYRDNDDIKRGG